jgi:hypothetical protein
MRKGLFVTLAIVAIALLSGSVYAFAPVINPVPDIVIGDQEDEAGWTIDRNFFRFTNAFSFLDYVNDQDTTETLIKWSFIEETSPGGTPADWFEIAGITQTTVGNTNPPPGAKDLTLAGTDYTPDIRDIYASPSGQDPGPYTGIVEGAQHSKLIWLYASDGTREDSADTMVFSIDGEYDALSGGATFIKTYTFDTDLEGWSFLGLTTPDFSAASSGYSGGRISISSANDSTSRVGLFSGPTDIGYVANNVYRARYVVSSSQATASQNPQFRMRWIQDQSLESATTVINASGTYSNSLPTDPSTDEYSCYLLPVLAYNLGVAFDMLDFDAGQYGTHYVDEVTVERFERSGTGTAVKTYTDSSDFANWSYLTNIGAYGPVTSGGAGTGTLSMTSATADAANFGFWQSSGSANELTYVADKLYRAIYTLRCSSDVARNTMPQIRLRCQNEDGQVTQTMELNSQGVGPGAMPTTGGTTYDVYWETPTLPGSPTTANDGFIVTIDVLDFDAAKGGTIYMDSVAVDYLAIP